MRLGFLHTALMALMAALMMPTCAAHAHEIRPAYLQIDEIGPGRYQLLWRTPVLSGMRLPVVLRLPDNSRRHRAGHTRAFRFRD